MVEQADTGKCHRHLILVAGIDHMVITDGASRLRNIFYAASVRTLNIIAKWEECV